jgi:hypothetical protein
MDGCLLGGRFKAYGGIRSKQLAPTGRTILIIAIAEEQLVASPSGITLLSLLEYTVEHPAIPTACLRRNATDRVRQPCVVRSFNILQFQFEQFSKSCRVCHRRTPYCQMLPPKVNRPNREVLRVRLTGICISGTDGLSMSSESSARQVKPFQRRYYRYKLLSDPGSYQKDHQPPALKLTLFASVKNTSTVRATYNSVIASLILRDRTPHTGQLASLK